MTDETCCGACGYPIHATKESACDWCRQSADRIEELERKNAEMNKLYGEVKEGLEAKLAKAMELLRFISQMHGYTSRQLSDLARTKLAELEGGE
jgi:predicted house-cleaning noncanonical NTP pyrophosphatase (MazG superfamily)